jgi:hypothetical protein
MRPSHHEKTESIVIKYVHLVVLYPGGYAPGGGGPTCEPITGFRITHDYGKQRLTTTIYRYGHLMQRLIGGSGCVDLLYIFNKIII